MEVGRSNPQSLVYTSEPRNVSQKPSTSPAVRDTGPALYQTSLNKPDELLSNASGPLSFFELAGVSYKFCSDSLVEN